MTNFISLIQLIKRKLYFMSIFDDSPVQLTEFEIKETTKHHYYDYC